MQRPQTTGMLEVAGRCGHGEEGQENMWFLKQSLAAGLTG